MMIQKRTIVSFLILCIAFFAFGQVVQAFPIPDVVSFYGEAVFSKSPQLSIPPLYLSALPFSAVHPKPAASSPPAKKVQEEKVYPSFAADPPKVEGKLQIQNRTGYTVSIDECLSMPLSIPKDGPTVLILHTHTSEAYAQSPAYSYEASDMYRTENTDYNMCRVGRALKESLEKNGIQTIHDTTSHDFPSYSGSYQRSLATIEKNLAQHPGISVVIDLHRDAISDAQGNYLKTVATVEGKSSAQPLVIVGTDWGGLPHPNWRENLALGMRLQDTLCTLYPGLARPLQLRTERFNGHALRGALLLEIGSCGNTLEEALYAAELVGNALSKTLLSLMP